MPCALLFPIWCIGIFCGAEWIHAPAPTGCPGHGLTLLVNMVVEHRLALAIGTGLCRRKHKPGRG